MPAQQSINIIQIFNIPLKGRNTPFWSTRAPLLHEKDKIFYLVFGNHCSLLALTSFVHPLFNTKPTGGHDLKLHPDLFFLKGQSENPKGPKQSMVHFLCTNTANCTPCLLGVYTDLANMTHTSRLDLHLYCNYQIIL